MIHPQTQGREKMKRTGRRAFIAQALALVVVATLGGARSALGDSSSSLLDAETLKLELRTKTEAEAAYIDEIVEKAKEGKIPVKFLTVAYRYAMQREAGRRPLYFKICLEQLTKKAGLNLTFSSF